MKLSRTKARLKSFKEVKRASECKARLGTTPKRKNKLQNEINEPAMAKKTSSRASHPCQKGIHYNTMKKSCLP